MRRGRRRTATVFVGLAIAVGTALPTALAGTEDNTEAPEPSESPTPSPSPSPSPDPSPVPSPSPSPVPSPSPSPDPEPSPSPSPSPVPEPSPEPSPSPTENCGAEDAEGVVLGDVDVDCDGTLLLSEQERPVSIRRTLALPPVAEEDGEDGQDDAPLDGGPTEPATAPVELVLETDEFVDGPVVEFDATSEEGGTIREGSLVYSPPAGFTGTDRFTFLYDDGEWVREAEVVVEVVIGDGDEEASPTPSPSPTIDEAAEDAAQRALAEIPFLGDDGDRWNPPWLVWLSLLAMVLVALAVSWWLFLEVRIQDRLRS